MTKELKDKILQHLEWMQGLTGQQILVKDWISTSGRGYDKHQTRYGKQIIKIENYSVRMSGAMATIYSEHQQIEYRTDAIKMIECIDDECVLEINMKGDVWRRIHISKI